MTINVAVVTNEYLVLGCDSVASVTQMYLNPFDFIERDAEGNFTTDADGNFVARFKYPNLEQVVKDAWGGVTKMFCLCDEFGDTPVAAVTAGIAQLNQRSISAIAYEFSKSIAVQSHPTVRAVVDKFVEYVGAQYDSHHEASGVPPALRTDLEFLVGGFASSDHSPALYRVNMIHPQDTRITPIYGTGTEFGRRTGAAWSGQADGVQRLLFGYDLPLQYRIQRDTTKLVDDLHGTMSAAALRILEETLKALNSELPPGIDTELPPKPPIQFDWNQFTVNIDFANLPLQSAVELVSYLVNLQSGKSKFVQGVPTVGGRTHIGIVKKDGFEMLNEPELTHRNTGYDRDL